MRPNTPADVSILVGMPLTEEAYYLRIETSDWLGKFAGEPAAAESYWRRVYLPDVVTPVQELIASAEKLGAKVREGTLQNLCCATSQSRVVVVLAHWRGWEIAIDDLTPGLTRTDWLDRASSHSSPLARWLAARFRIERSSVVRSLEDSLNIELPEPSLDVRVHESPVTRKTRRRDEIDSIFEGMIQPGNRLELLDGMHSRESLETAIAADYDGILDLAACTSTVPGDYISRRRRFALRTISAPQNIRFDGLCFILGKAIEGLEDGGFSYTQTRALAIEAGRRAK